MTAHVLRLTLWEWFKLRRRWMPWVLLIVAVILVQTGIWFAYAAYHNETLQEFSSAGSSTFSVTEEVDDTTVRLEVTCVDLEYGDLPEGMGALSEEQRGRFLSDVEQFRTENCGDIIPREIFQKAFTVPQAITDSTLAMMAFAPILVMILVSSLVGAEYGWGTLRPALTRGVGRWQFLASKPILALLLCVAGFAALAILTIAASLLAAVVPPGEAGTLSDPGSWSEAAVMFGKAVYGLAPYVALSMFLAVLMQSSATAMAVSLGYYVVELIASPILNVTSWGGTIADFLIGNNVSGWMDSAFVSLETNGTSSTANQPDTLQAFLVILVYTAVLGGAAFRIFLRRDIGGARGD